MIRKLALGLLLLSACGDDEHGGPADAGPDDGVDAGDDAGDDIPPEICKDPAALGPGPYFTEVTDQIGPDFALLDETIPALEALYGDEREFGERLGTTWMAVSGADVDGNGYPDVFVHIAPGPPVLRDPMASDDDHLYRRILRPVPGEFPRFEDVTRDSGYLAVREGEGGRPAGGAVFGDVDNDGNLDVFSFGGEDPAFPTDDRAEVMLGDGTGHFTLASRSAPSDDDWNLAAASFLDYDLDGVLDLFLGYWWGNPPYGRQNLLLRGNGDGTFDDVTDPMGLTTVESWAAFVDGTSTKPTFGATACDIDRDGDQDIVTSTYGRQLNALWRNDGDHFTNIAVETGYDADDELDYSDDQYYRCYCRRTGRCEADPPQIMCPDSGWQVGFSDLPNQLGGNTFSTACDDLDDDGDLDLLTGEIRHWWAGRASDASRPLLQEPGGDAGFFFARPDLATIGFEQPHHTIDWNEGNQTLAVTDFDCDGYKDVLLCSSDYPDTDSLLYRRNADGTYEEISEAAGVRIPRGHDVLAVDLDRDGDRDLIIGTSMMRDPGPYDRPSPRFFRNDVGQDSNWTAIRLHGAGAGAANSSGIGALVEITAGGRTQLARIDGGHGIGGIHHDLVAWFGLGDACSIDTVRVHWPDAAHSVSEFTDVRANYYLDITQGEDRVRYDVP